MSVTDSDNGYDALVKRVFGMTKVTIAVGILEADGAATHEAEDGGRGHEDATVLEIAIWNEFGTSDGHVPERSFVRAWFDANESRLRADLTALMRSVVDGKRTREQVLSLLAQRSVGEIQQRIADGISPENAQSTIDRKHSSTPLIAGGQLRSALSYEIREGE
jgi:hypothetical protein